MAAVLMACAALSGSLHGDDIADYLESRGLDQLLAAHLEERLDVTLDDGERDRLAQRLATTYARLLERASDRETMADLEQRGRRLLAVVPPAGAAELRLVVLRASYRSAVLTAEAHRLRRASTDEVDRALETLRGIVPELEALATELAGAVETAERRLSRSTGVEAALLADEAEQLRRLAIQTRFLAAWGNYYRAWLSGESPFFVVADTMFVELLDTGLDSPRPEDVSDDLRSLESYARSILGLALVRGRLQRPSAGLEWLALLGKPGTFEPLQEELPAWRLAILLDDPDLNAALKELDGALAADPDLPTAWVRMAAARAIEWLEEPNRHPGARALADRAVGELAARGELADVLDLARRYGAERLGGTGFVLKYVRAVELYEAARRAHPGEESATEPAARTMFEHAAEAFGQSLAEPDAAAFAGAAAGSRGLRAWSLYFAGRSLDAADAFVAAAETQAPEQADDSLWMAVVCLDRAMSSAAEADRPALERRIAALGDEYLARYPSSEHAPRLTLRRIIAAGEVSPAAVDALRAIPPGSDVYSDARRQAVHMEYLLFRQAPSGARPEIASTFLAAAMPIFEDDVALLRDVDRPRGVAEVEAMLLRARQILEVSVAANVDRADLARRVFEHLEDLGERRIVDLAVVEDELDHRRMQMAILAGDVGTAEALARAIFDRAPESIWAASAARVLFRAAAAAWSENDVEGGEEGALLAVIVRAGQRVLEDMDDASIGADQGLLSTLSIVARAEARRWARSGAREDAERAFTSTERLLAIRPDDPAALLNAASLAEALDRREVAIERLRRLVMVTGAGSDPWFEARTRLIEMLAPLDSARAREILDQHLALYPDYGPAPWGSRLRELDLRLPRPVRDDAPRPREAAP